MIQWGLQVNPDLPQQFGEAAWQLGWHGDCCVQLGGDIFSSSPANQSTVTGTRMLKHWDHAVALHCTWAVSWVLQPMLLGTESQLRWIHSPLPSWQSVAVLLSLYRKMHKLHQGHSQSLALMVPNLHTDYFSMKQLSLTDEIHSLIFCKAGRNESVPTSRWDWNAVSWWCLPKPWGEGLCLNRLCF